MRKSTAAIELVVRAGQRARARKAVTFGALAIACGISVTHGAPSARPSMSPEPTIALRDVKGRIDHLAADTDGGRLFVAELGNDSVDVIDINTRSLTQRIAGLAEPQGVAYSARTQTLYVASGGDGVLHTYSGAHLEPMKSVVIGSDADNVRVDDTNERVYVAFDSGIAVLNSAHLNLIARVPLKAHPESFQLQSRTQRLFVNVPEAKEIAVIDLASFKQIGSWETAPLASNFALALDASSETVIAAFRQPPKLAVYETASGKLLHTPDLCGDSDDVYLDAKRATLYASCGEGFVDVFDLHNHVRTERIVTRSGARTSLYVPQWNQLFVAARATAEQPAAVLVYKIGD